MSELIKRREKVCAWVNYFGYGSLCPDSDKCRFCRELEGKKK